uniref:DNA helicase Pif1-like 2B domain-containing protein n=1 Tax=Brassica oleracea TaxID=3712 RepID=A0A3P6EHK0_BRAOL|nr:unnamed protein product [Brassica oleracea]
MLSKLDGEEMIYLSSDSIDPSDTASVNNDALSSDFLNNIKVSGLPNHSLRLKIGCPVMLLRNINPTEANGGRFYRFWCVVIEKTIKRTRSPTEKTKNNYRENKKQINEDKNLDTNSIKHKQWQTQQPKLKSVDSAKLEPTARRRRMNQVQPRVGTRDAIILTNGATEKPCNRRTTRLRQLHASSTP